MVKSVVLIVVAVVVVRVKERLKTKEVNNAITDHASPL